MNTLVNPLSGLLHSPQQNNYAGDGDNTLVVNPATDSVLAPGNGKNHEVIGEVITTEKTASDE